MQNLDISNILFMSLLIDRYDIDGSGSIDINELKRALESMGQNPSDEEVDIIMCDDIDPEFKPHDGLIRFSN